MKVPRYFCFVAEIPDTAIHKVAKHRLRDDPELMNRAIDLQASEAMPKI